MPENMIRCYLPRFNFVNHLGVALDDEFTWQKHFEMKTVTVADFFGSVEMPLEKPGD